MLNLQTPHTLADCGCSLETGDAGRPLFVPCQLHRAAEGLANALGRAQMILDGVYEGRMHVTIDDRILVRRALREAGR